MDLIIIKFEEFYYKLCLRSQLSIKIVYVRGVIGYVTMG